jgi:plasmid stabilization system protein ParE
VRVTFNELAERELIDAAQYYERAQPGLGTAFIEEVRRCSAAVAEYPHSDTVVLGNIRRRLCQRFPYGLLYTVAGDELRILAVMNLKRPDRLGVGSTSP